MPLDSPSVSGVATEQSVEELLNEFFKCFFTGAVGPNTAKVNAVDTPDGEIEFLVASLAFQAGPLDFSGPNRAVVHTVFSDLKPVRVWTSNEAVREYTTPVTLMIFARILNEGYRGRESDFQARKLGDQVRYLFESPATRAALSQKGITHARVVRGPVPQPFPGYQVRVLTVMAILRYSITLPEEEP